MAVKIFLLAGHGGSSPGAVYHGRKEATEAIKLVDAVYKKVKPHMPKNHELVKVPHSLDYKNGADWVKARLGPYDIVIDFHFNAFHDQRATGTETLYQSNPGFAKRVNVNTVRKLNLANRGTKQRTDLYLLNVLPDSAALLEVCFLSNKSDMARYDKVGIQAVSNAVYSVAKGANVTLPKPEPEPEPEPPKVEPPKDVTEPAKLPQPETRRVEAGAKLIDAKTNKVVKTYKKEQNWGVYASFTWNGVDFYQTKYSFNAKSWTGVPQHQFVPLEPEHGEEPDSEVSVEKQIKDLDNKVDGLTEQVETLERIVRAIQEFLSAVFKGFKE